MKRGLQSLLQIFRRSQISRCHPHILPVACYIVIRRTLFEAEQSPVRSETKIIKIEEICLLVGEVYLKFKTSDSGNTMEMRFIALFYFSTRFFTSFKTVFIRAMCVHLISAGFGIAELVIFDCATLILTSQY